MSELRPYQVTAIDSALAALSNSGSAVLQMPTGAGKTRAATEIIKRWYGVVWFICHRQEIERQASGAFTAAGIDHGIVSPRGLPEYGKRVQVVSVATLARRIGELPPPSLVIWDECQHVAAKSWSAIREQLSDTKHLGLTATPERLDGKGLAGWFAELVVGPSTRELIDDEWLSDFRYFAPSEPDLTGAKLRAGDYRKEDVAKAMNVPVLIGDAIAEYRAKADGKRALVFCAGVEASKALVERFNAEGIPARHIDGTTSTSARDEAVAQLGSGEIKVLSNVEVFTEGFDLPAIDAVILLRPTKSLALFLQMVGRVLRRAEGKSEALIFDHAGLWLDHDWFDLPISWSLDGGARKRRLAGRTHGPRRCPECKEVRAEREPVCGCGYEFPSGREIGEYDGDLREMRGVVPEGCVSKIEFSRSVDASIQAISKWCAEGMPSLGRGIPFDEALAWVQKNKDLRARRSVRRPPEQGDFESCTAFGKRIGTTPHTVIRLKKQGLPHASNGWIEIGPGVEWIKSNWLSRIHPPGGEVGGATESPKLFEQRVGVARGTAHSWKKRGLPQEKNSWIHIQRGLEWVRDNTSIPIPPEAWPSTNDNATLSAAA